MGDQLLVGSCSGNFYALDSKTGDANWTYEAFNDGANQFHGIPAMADSIVYVGTDEGSFQVGSLYAFNINDGSLIWKRDAGAGATSDLIIRDSLLYMVTLGDRVLAINRRDGSEVWSFETSWYREDGQFWDELERGPRVATTPILQDSFFVVPGRDDIVYCLNATSGRQVWQTQLPNPASSQLCLVDSLIAVGTDQSELLFLTLPTGSIVRTDSLEWLVRESMVWRNGMLYFLGGSQDDWRTGVIAAYDIEARKIIWSRQTVEDEYWYVPRLYVRGNELCAGTTEGEFLGLNLMDGSTSFECHVDGPVRSVTSDQQTIYIGTFTGLLYSCELK